MRYDIYFLLTKRAELRWDIVEKKLAYYKLSFNDALLESALKEVERSWDSELRHLMKRVPEYSNIREVILQNLASSRR